MDIFDRIASEYQKSQPLRLRRDYGEVSQEGHSFKQAQMTKEKFKKRMEEDPEFAEKWNAQTVHSKEEMDEKLGRKAGHYHKGPYMSIQHILEMRDLVDGISEMIHRGDDIPDWAESKIAHAHQILLDLVGYFQYGEGYRTDEDKSF